jgi:WD40-like Beta Propeller Repeat
MTDADGPVRRGSWAWPTMGLLCVLAIAAAFGLPYRRGRPPLLIRTELTRLSQPDEHSRLGPAISPDGKSVAYSSNRSGKWELWLQQLGGGEPVQLTHSDGVVGGPAFLPDSTRILYSTTSPTFEEGTIEIVSTRGGEPQQLWSGKIVTSPVDLRGPTLSPDGSRVAYLEPQTDGRLRLVVLSTAGGRPRPVPGFDRLQLWPRVLPPPAWTPDGRFVLYVAASARDQINWEWYAIPVDGGEPVESGAGEALRRAGFDVASPAVMFGNRVIYWGTFARPHVFDIPLSPDTWKVSGTPRQLTFGSERYYPTTVSTTGKVAIETLVQSVDFYAIPLDPATGHASGVTRRLTKDGMGSPVFDVGGNPRWAYVVAWENGSNGLVAKAEALDLESGNATPLGPFDLGRNAGWAVSRDGRRIAHSRPEHGAYSVSINEAGVLPSAERVLCHDCGLAQGFSPDGRSLFYLPEAQSKPNSRAKTTVHLLDVESGSSRPWLSDANDALGVLGITGERADWVVVTAKAPASPIASARRYLVPWREGPVPRSDWIDVGGENVKFSPAGNVAYFFEGTKLMARRFDPKPGRIGPPYEVKLATGSSPILKPDDEWVVRASGIVFSPTDIKSSIWLLDLSKDSDR